MAPNPHKKKPDARGYRKEDVDRDPFLLELLKQARTEGFSVREKGRLFSLLPWRSLGIPNPGKLKDLVQMTIAGAPPGPVANETQLDRRTALLVGPDYF
jgi:hypothetical protein